MRIQKGNFHSMNIIIVLISTQYQGQYVEGAKLSYVMQFKAPNSETDTL